MRDIDYISSSILVIVRVQYSYDGHGWSSFTMRFLTSLLFFLHLLGALVLAQQSPSNDTSAVFIYKGEKGTQLIFALNADSSTGDLYFHLSSPSGNAWVGVGIGSEMSDSLMLIAYPDASTRGVTISPRTTTGHVEPTYQESLKIEKKGDNTVTGNVDENGPNGPGGPSDDPEYSIIAEGVCRNCSVWDSEKFDITSDAQPFIFAVGPPYPIIASDSQDASLSQHSFIGHFTMDMTVATSSSGGSVPQGPFIKSSHASTALATKSTTDLGSRIHGLVMCIVFVLLLPLGSLILRVWNKVNAHAGVQVVGLVLFCVAFAGGCIAAKKFNKSKHFDSTHQVVGILILLALFSQLALGVVSTPISLGMLLLLHQHVKKQIALSG